MSSVEDFFALPFEGIPSKWAAASTRRASAPQGHLLIDHLLRLASLPDLVYAPSDVSADLHRWLIALERHSDLGHLQRHALRFYLLLDLAEQEEQRDSRRADAYAKRFLMPNNFVAAIRGYWCLDAGDYQNAVLLLARPGVDVDVPLLPSIVELLAKEAPHQLIRFVQMARSKVDAHLSNQDVSRVIAAMVEVGQVNVAFKLMRSVVDQQGTDTDNEALLQGYITLVLQTALGVNTTGQPVPAALRQLLQQPLSMQEDVLFCSSALTSPSPQLAPSSNDLLLDLVLNRLSAQGRHLEAMRLLNATTIKPASTDAARRRALLHRNLKSLLSDVDLSVLSLDPSARQPQDEAAEEEDDSVMGGQQVTMGHHPWAPQESTDEDRSGAPKSLAEAQRNAQSRAQALQEAARAEKHNAPLSASPALRRRAQGNEADQSADVSHRVVEALKLAAMSKSPSHFQLTRSPTLSRQGSPAPSSSQTDIIRPRASGSPFVSRAPTAAAASRKSSVQPAEPPRQPANNVSTANAVGDVSMTSNATATFDTSTHSPIVHRTRNRNKRDIKIRVPATPGKMKEQSMYEGSPSKRPAAAPHVDAGPAKMQALEPQQEEEEEEAPSASTPRTKQGATNQKPGRSTAKKQTRVHIEPASTSKGRIQSAAARLPGHFDMDLEHGSSESDELDLLSKRTDTETETEEDEDAAEPFSAMTATSSMRKPRHIRANAPEPPTPAHPLPTPRRSARLSASVSRESSVESIGGRSGRGAKPRGGRRANRREESVLEEEGEE